MFFNYEHRFFSVSYIFLLLNDTCCNSHLLLTVLQNSVYFSGTKIFEKTWYEKILKYRKKPVLLCFSVFQNIFDGCSELFLHKLISAVQLIESCDFQPLAAFFPETFCTWPWSTNSKQKQRRSGLDELTKTPASILKCAIDRYYYRKTTNVIRVGKHGF